MGEANRSTPSRLPPTATLCGRCDFVVAGGGELRQRVARSGDTAPIPPSRPHRPRGRTRGPDSSRAPTTAAAGSRGRRRSAASVGEQRARRCRRRGRRPHVEVFQVDAVAALPGGEVEEPQHHADRLVVGVDRDVAEQRRAVGRTGRRAAASSVRWHSSGARSNSASSCTIATTAGTSWGRTGWIVNAIRAHACLVSQKILEISSIFASSLSATAGSAEPFAPVAPASLVASLNSACSCGYFSKCGGLK